MNLHKPFLLVLMGVLLVSSAGCLRGVGPTGKLEQALLPVYQYREAEEIVSFVDAAAAAIRERGEDVFPEFRKRGLEWFEGDRYIFVWGLDGHRYVYPPDLDGEGKNMLSLKDINGRPIGREFVKIARSPQGEGWSHYQWTRPDMDKPEWKSTYIRYVRSPSGKEYLVGSGIYNKRVERVFVIQAVDDAARLLKKEGKGAFDVIGSPCSKFVYLNLYVFIKDMEGTELVNPFNRELVGENIAHLKDIYGKEFVRRELDCLREKDCCWMEYWWHKPNETEPSQKVACLKKVEVGEETLVVGSGYYPEVPVYGSWVKQMEFEGQNSEGEIRINPDNTFEFVLSKELNHHTNTSGRVAIQNNRIYFYDNECTGIGIYEVSIMNRELRLKGVKDACSIRKSVLEGIWKMKASTASASRIIENSLNYFRGYEQGHTFDPV